MKIDLRENVLIIVYIIYIYIYIYNIKVVSALSKLKFGNCHLSSVMKIGRSVLRDR